MPKWIAPLCSNVNLATNQPEYEPISVRKSVTTVPYNDGTDEHFVAPCYTAAIQFDQAEIDEICKNGGVVYLTLLSDRWPPASLTVTDEKLDEHMERISKL